MRVTVGGGLGVGRVLGWGCGRVSGLRAPMHCANPLGFLPGGSPAAREMSAAVGSDCSERGVRSGGVSIAGCCLPADRSRLYAIDRDAGDWSTGDRQTRDWRTRDRRLATGGWRLESCLLSPVDEPPDSTGFDRQNPFGACRVRALPVDGMQSTIGAWSGDCMQSTWISVASRQDQRPSGVGPAAGTPVASGSQRPNRKPSGKRKCAGPPRERRPARRRKNSRQASEPARRRRPNLPRRERNPSGAATLLTSPRAEPTGSSSLAHLTTSKLARSSSPDHFTASEPARRRQPNSPRRERTHREQAAGSPHRKRACREALPQPLAHLRSGEGRS